MFSGKKYSCVFGANMGGVIKIWSRQGKLIYEDCGYFLKFKRTWLTTQGESSFSYKEKGPSI